jgi:short-subunit dehydrogenase
MTTKALQGRTALITGASSGIGEAIAHELARYGAAVVLVARREDRLRAVAADIQKKYGTRAEVSACDLSRPDAPEMLFAAMAGQPIDVLVNNAGFGICGKFADIPWKSERSMLEVDIMGLIGLTKAFLRPMVERKFGRILLVSSIGAFQPTPMYASYAAAKSFVLNFGYAIDNELAGTGVRCTSVCPGVTASEFAAVAGQTLNRVTRSSMMSSEAVAKSAVRAMLRGRTSVTPGLMNALMAAGTRFVPRRLATTLAGLFVK